MNALLWFFYLAVPLTSFGASWRFFSRLVRRGSSRSLATVTSGLLAGVIAAAWAALFFVCAGVMASGMHLGFLTLIGLPAIVVLTSLLFALAGPLPEGASRDGTTGLEARLESLLGVLALFAAMGGAWALQNRELPVDETVTLLELALVALLLFAGSRPAPSASRWH